MKESINLGSWMNDSLIGWGMSPKCADVFDETIVAALMIALAIHSGIFFLRVKA